MSAPASRRGFLRGLTTLPLIGGSVALIGSPTGAAQPVTPGMLATYNAWLFYERKALCESFQERNAGAFIPCLNPGSEFHFPLDFDHWRFGYDAQQRAPVILAAAGCPLTSAEAEEQWATTFRPCWKERS